MAAKADKSRAEAKIEYAKGIEALKEKQEEVKKKLRELKNTGEEASKDLKAGVESALFDLKKAGRRGIQGGMPPWSKGVGSCPGREGEAGSLKGERWKGES